ncbi:MAG: response regulator [Myxococcales bacterium]
MEDLVAGARGQRREAVHGEEKLQRFANRLLIVDDQPAVRTALETLFEVHDLPTVVVSTPDEALNLLATEDIGAVVQDMNFSQAETSGDEGTTLFRSIRALDPDMPVLLMTAWS